MYVTNTVNGVIVIQRHEEAVLSVCDHNWEFANWTCAVLNELDRMSDLLLTEESRGYWKVIDAGFGRKVQHA